jgi:hypothetical protein
MSILSTFKYVDQALKVLFVTEGVLELTGDNDSHETEQEHNMSDENQSRTIVEEIELEGKYLVKRVKELIHEGNIRTLRIKDSKGKYLLEIPLTVGVVAGGVFALSAPVWAALGALAAALAKLTIEVERTVEPAEDEPEADDDK